MSMIRYGAVIAAATLTATAAQAMQVSFSGGTVKEYLSTLKEIDPDIRLVVHPDADWFEMPAVEFTDISVRAAIESAALLHDAMDVQIVADNREPRSIEHATYVVSVDPEAMARLMSIELDDQSFNLDFPGGDMQELVAELRTLTSANILLTPEAASVQAPAMTLRRADLHNLLITISGRLRAPEDGAGEVVVNWAPTSGAGAPLYVIEIDSPKEPEAQPEPRVHHWALGFIVEHTPVSAEDVLGAIEVAQEFFEDELVVRYHEPTRTLIAKGLDADLQVIDQLIRRVQQSAESLRQGD